MLKNKFKLFILSALLVLNLSLCGDSYLDIEFEAISNQHGLSQNTIFCMIQDRDGFLWIGTEDGLNRYDGYTFLILRRDPKDKHSLSGNNIRAMKEDRTGILWIGTWGDGLNRLDRETLKCTHYKQEGLDARGLSNNFVMAIIEDHEGVLWIGTQGGLNRFDPGTGRFTHYRTRNSQSSSLSDDCILALCESSSEDIWIGTQEGGLNKFDRKHERFSHYKHIPGDPSSLSHNSVRAIIEERPGILWLGTRGGGLNRFDTLKNQFKCFRFPGAVPGSISGNHILSVFKDSKGGIWVGTRENGVYILNPFTETFTHYYTDWKNPHSLNDDTILSIYEDRTGIIFLGTGAGGINKFSPWKRKFKHLEKNPFDPHGLTSSHVWAICEDKEGFLWIGTDDGLNRLDREKNVKEHYLHRPGNPGGLSSSIARSLLVDSQGNLWVGTLGGGLNRRDRKQDTFKHYTHNPLDKNSINHNQVFNIYEDRRGRLWVGLYGGGLDLMDRKKDHFIHFIHQSANPRSLSNNFISDIFHDSSGDLWIGTSDGLNLWEKEDHRRLSPRFTHYTHVPTQAETISDSGIKCIYQDSAGTLWVGTDRGLNRWHSETRTFTHYIMEDGLPSGMIYGILEDKNGRLWLSTNHGLSCFDHGAGTFRNYDISSGLQSNEFNGGAYYKSKNGEMFFGGIKGLNFFYPDTIKDNPFSPQVVITDFKKFNRSVRLDKLITYKKEITLSHKDNFISFDMAVLDFNNPQKNRYSYMLEGFDRDWIDNGTDRSISYTNLEGRTYWFRVKGSNHDGTWNQEGISLKIVIIPPFWQLWWFRIMVVLLVGLGGIRFYFWRTRRFRRQRVKLEKLVKKRTAEVEKEKERVEAAARARDEFLANMSHEIRTPMNAIIGMTELTLESHLNLQQRTNLAVVKSSADKLLTIIDDILELTRIESGELQLESKTFHLRGTLEPMITPLVQRAQKKNLTFHSVIEPGIPQYLIGDPVRLRQVLKNLLLNAVKFTEQGEIRLEIRKVGESETRDTLALYFSVSDTGIGVHPEKQEEIFVAFVQADSSFSRQFGGAGLGLSISSRLVKLMGGDIRVKSPASFPPSSIGGPGANFYFTLSFKVATPPAVKQETVPSSAVADTAPTIGMEKLNILVAEDNKINQRLIAMQLQQLGHTFTLVENGEEVLKKVKTKAGSFDLIFMDLQMPLMDGIKATRAIRKMEEKEPDRHIPIIALTAHNTDEDRRKVMQAGMDDHVAKPVSASKLITAIQKAIPLIQKNRN